MSIYRLKIENIISIIYCIYLLHFLSKYGIIQNEIEYMSLQMYYWCYASEFDMCVTVFFKIGHNYLNFSINNRKGFY